MRLRWKSGFDIDSILQRASKARKPNGEGGWTEKAIENIEDWISVIISALDINLESDELTRSVVIRSLGFTQNLDRSTYEADFNRALSLICKKTMQYVVAYPVYGVSDFANNLRSGLDGSGLCCTNRLRGFIM